MWRLLVLGATPAFLVVYACSYYGLVKREPVPLAPLQHNMATYKVGGVFSHTLFLPIHCLDRKLRPNFWKPEFPDLPSLTSPFRNLNAFDATTRYFDMLARSFLMEFGLDRGR